MLVHSSGAVLFPGEDERAVPPNGLLTFVAVRRPEGWRLAAFNNTPTGRARDARFLLRYLRSRVGAFRPGRRRDAARP
ncbi:hypothetical protein [Dactylosporangium sp. NPDC048998]|uniref:hypothetical protein n=1 Tax=Dactylosporangium sp. NPDC048998 TaxID=3363976 RepID=UPI003720CAB7